MAKKPTVSFPYSKVKFEISKVLESGGYLTDLQKKGRKNLKLIEAKLVYENRMPKISDVNRVSKPSRRIYRAYRDIFSVKNGLGVAVYSTPKGLLTDKEAKKQKVGGELLFEIW